MTRTSRFSARPSFLFLAGLGLATTIAIGADGAGRVSKRSILQLDFSSAPDIAPLAPRALSEADMEAARAAWGYMVANTAPETGLVGSVAGYPSSTMWDQASYLLGTVSAERLGVIDAGELSWRMDQLLTSLGKIALFDGQLPNKAYHTRTLAMVDYANRPTPEGIGWSAIDIGRLLIAFRVLEERHPRYRDWIRGIVSKWNLDGMALNGELWGTQVEDGETEYVQEGRLGYEQYAARGAALWGLDATSAISAARVMEWQEVSGVEIPTDMRVASSFGAITPILSEPYMLQGLEMGLNGEGAQLAERIYRAQEARWRETGQLTAVSEDHINQKPSFLYNSVFANGRDWAVVTEDGSFHPELRTVSLKASFAWDALYGTDYTAQLREELADLATSNGWHAGRYETGGEINDIRTLNTNGIVLEALHYKAFGPLLP